MLFILIEDDKHKINVIVFDGVKSKTEMLIINQNYINERIGMFCKYFCEK